MAQAADSRRTGTRAALHGVRLSGLRLILVRWGSWRQV